MSDIKLSALWAISGVVIGFATIAISYWWLHTAMPGYKVLVGPGIATANLFTEEINLWPKITIMLTGQYLTYFIIIFLGIKLRNRFLKR